MFQIQLTVETVDYEATFRTIFPFLMEKCRQHREEHFLFRLVDELDSAAQPVLLGIIRHISNETRDELLCQCMKVYGPTLTSSLNHYLQGDSWERNFTIGRMNVERREGALLVVGENVQADFRALLNSDSVKDKIGATVDRFAGRGLLGKLAEKAAQGALNAVREMSPDEIEKGGAALLENPVVQNRLLHMVDKALNSRGIAITLSGVEIVPNGCAAVPPHEGQMLTPELEAAVIHAISEYLKQSVPDKA